MVQNYLEHIPQLHTTARVAETAAVVGKVHLAAESSIWYGVVLRGDSDEIYIGEGSNIQDNAVCHCDRGHPVRVGRDVTVGHSAILHGCTIGDGSLIGMGAILLDGCVIGAGSMVAAGALVTHNTVIPDGSVAMGAPAKVVRTILPNELEDQRGAAAHYRERAADLLPAPGTAERESQ